MFHTPAHKQGSLKASNFSYPGAGARLAARVAADAAAIVRGRIVLGSRPSAHLYRLGVEWDHPTAGVQRMDIDVHARNRAQAASIATRSGYTVCDVNMIG